MFYDAAGIRGSAQMQFALLSLNFSTDRWRLAGNIDSRFAFPVLYGYLYIVMEPVPQRSFLMKNCFLIALAVLSSVLTLFLTSCCTTQDVIASETQVYHGEVFRVRSLDYLKQNQNDDGSWGQDSEHHVGLTSICTFAFLAYGETPSSQFYGTTVLKGLKRLLAYGEERAKAKSPDSLWGACENSLLLWTLSESYAMTRIPMIEKSANALLEKLVADQAHLGFYNNKTENDLIVASLTFLGIKALFISTDDETGMKLEKFIYEGLDSLTKDYSLPDGSFARKKGDKNSDLLATSMAIFSLIFGGRSNDPTVGKGYKWLINYKASNDKPLSIDWDNPPDGNWAPLRWYAMTEVIFKTEKGFGPNWRIWNESWRQFMNVQDKNGSWTVPVPEGKGLFSKSDGTLWSTALITGIWAPRKYMPTFKVQVKKEMEEEGRKADDSLIIE